jgi:hypothetical protein
MSTKRKFFLLLLFFGVATAAVGFYFFNKGPGNIRNRKTLPVTATELYNAFVVDPAAAQQKFSGKALLVSGLIIKLDKNQQNETLVFLETNEENGYINCSMQNPATGLKVNEAVKIKGLCSGIGQGDADLGIKADVYLTNCIVAEQ